MMELKVIVLSLACFSLLMPLALGSLSLAKAAPFNAIKGATLIGAGLALKGKAALLGVEGLTELALKGAAIKGLLTNAASQNSNVGTVVLQWPVYYPKFPLNTAAVVRPNLFDILSGVWRAVRKRVRNKVAIAGQVLKNMNCPPVVQYISRPHLYTMPVMGCFNKFKRK